jgi:TPR repeat protein
MLRAPPSPDPKVTVEFIDRQLARDNAYVQFKLGRMLLRGELFPANPRLGFAVSRVAAERGYGPACLLLAVDFYSGRHGLPKRHDLWAHYWGKWKTRTRRVHESGAVPAVVVLFPRGSMSRRARGGAHGLDEGKENGE